MLRIVTAGEGGRAVELCIRTAMADRDESEQWLITAVKLAGRWIVSFLVSPEDRLGGYTWCGPAHEVRKAVQDAMRAAGMPSGNALAACR